MSATTRSSPAGCPQVVRVACEVGGGVAGFMLACLPRHLEQKRGAALCFNVGICCYSLQVPLQIVHSSWLSGLCGALELPLPVFDRCLLLLRMVCCKQADSLHGISLLSGCWQPAAAVLAACRGSASYRDVGFFGHTVIKDACWLNRIASLAAVVCHGLVS